MLEIIISKEQENQRLNKFLAKVLNTAPQSFIYKMLRKKNIKLNGKKAAGDEILATGDKIELFLSDDTISLFSKKIQSNPYAGALNIIYEDENVIIINKPTGILSHPSISSDKDTIVDRLSAYLAKESNINYNVVNRPAIVNRLDRNTSGIIIAGKNLKAIQILNAIVKDHNMHKYYLTIVHGYLQKEQLAIQYHTKDESKNKVQIDNKRFNENAKEIKTLITPIDSAKAYTLVKVQLITGKTHQIRAVLNKLSHPILGDKKYKTNANTKFLLKHQLLHAHQIYFNDAYDELSYLKGKIFEAVPPNEFLKIKEKLF